ncbi:heterokaryon incompatibility protein-domain-containing protein [Paraphoma chrysanthemicola]|uniref:Heterokaryon incompatibility protein-domain-containing protein n=1 Tax=Paraphoma chrysanthemicola TaxID=798071 RepID=A0A8K0VTF0_9PLEO|nr:heterokaryon incompatibility protein-domain-containing protein [Paraphoma chrysanthemicola]
MADQGPICEVCAKTDFAFALDPSRWDNDPWLDYLLFGPCVTHQPSLKSLRNSALQGCPVCLLLMEALKLPLEPQEPEPWGRYEPKAEKKKKKREKREFEAYKSEEENSGPCLISATMLSAIHRDFAPANGVVVGLSVHLKVLGMSGHIGVIPSEHSPENIGTRNLLHHTDIDLCRQWLQQCQTEHHKCPSISESDLPTRLIDVGVPNDVVQPQLVESRGQKGLYVTLSHCWGESKPPSTTKANLSSRMAAIPTDSMPKTFRDAVDIVRSLGYRYLWIDSFCIVQDDDADWQHECASMAKIYSDCVVTLASPYASDCHGGFPRGLHPTPVKAWCDLPVQWPGTTDLDTVRLIHPYPSFHGRVDWDDSPLAERAWVLQERLLSPRWLYFGNDDLYFQCSTAQFDEHLRVPLSLHNAHLGLHTHAPKDALSFKTYEEGLSKWYSMLVTYSELCLTHGSDRLPALSGIASRFAEKLGDEYIAGMWRKDLAFGLCYTVIRQPRRSLHPPAIPGPSWSWYTCDRTVETPFVQGNRRINVEPSAGRYHMAQFDKTNCFGSLIEIISAHATIGGENSFGEVRNAKLTIKGRLRRVSYRNRHVYYKKTGQVLGKLSLDDFDNPRKRGSPKIFMLSLAVCGNWLDDSYVFPRWFALGLVKDLVEPDTYIRIGIIEPLDDDELRFMDVKMSKKRLWRKLNNAPWQRIYLI